MKKTLILGMVFLGLSSVFAFPFRTSCGIVFEFNDQGMTQETVTWNLKQLNFNACGVFPSKIVYYTSNVN